MSPEHAGDDDRSGRDVEAAVARAEQGTPVEGRHSDGSGSPTGESRVERAADVDEIVEGRSEGGQRTQPPPEPGPEPPAIGSGGAQRIVGARIPDRKSAGEPTPDGPPFDDDDA
ncbi:hypothetical protein [Conexibacter sp. CPCC 206217]|uniref:hypothetical protein n=1 Tax=Conexibacter sp. CPCC 206217 TaxID=3064574 RepID=UPI002724BB3E|nr:hypothetical protein [Conexibacter sp. CPCC 206217]MDO8211022.1 hypothetical protein [Conexibacter sp. CPCC 206217]